MAYTMGKTKINKNIPNMPYTGKLKDGSQVILDYYNEQNDYQQVKQIYFDALKAGISYPYPSMTEEEFKNYYLGGQTFVLRYDTQFQSQKIKGKDDVIGSFYIKPNFPGSCSHYCNGGFLVKETESGKGAAKFMGKRFIHIAKNLGYRNSMFNLVFKCNPASIRVWDDLGFKRTGEVKNVFKMKNGEYSDAIQFGYDFYNMPLPKL